MKNRHRVVWTKGMFLTPQHFQAQDQYFQDSLQFRVAASQFANWGITDLEIDAEGLKNGTFRLTKARGILPDGEAFDMPDVDELPPSRAIAGHFPETDKALDVYLALPERRLQKPNVTVLNEGADNAGLPSTRYSAIKRNITDEHVGTDDQLVQVARRNFRIIFGNEYRDGYSSFRAAQVVRNSAGVTMLNEQFVAPCLNLAHSEYLMRLLRRQIEILANKCQTLSGARRQKGKVLADFSAAETEKFWLLHTVNSYLPEIKHLYRVRHGHPEAAYTAMLRLAGALATFSLEANAADLPDYDHDNLGVCFTALDAAVRDVMDQVFQENYRSIPLTLTDRSVWTGAVPDDSYFKNSQFFLAVSAKMGVDDLIRKVPGYVKIAANDDIQRIIINSLAGIPLRHTPVPPAAIRIRLENQYFSLNQDGRLWDNVRLSRTLAISAASEIVEPKLEMIVVFE